MAKLILKFTTEYVNIAVLSSVTLVAMIILGRSDYIRSIVVYCMYALTLCWIAIEDNEDVRSIS